jgi:hypothetical protein
LQFYGAATDVLARGVQKYSCTPPKHPFANGADRKAGIGFATAGRGQEGHEKELAPGGHQEQGESRVTEFRAPDLEKTLGAEVANRIATAPFGEEYQRRHVNAT